MRPLRLVVSVAAFALCWAVASARAQDSTSSAGGDPYRDFRIPTHRWSSWNVDGRADGTSATDNQVSSTTKTGSYQAETSTNAVWGFDSDRAQRGISASFVIRGGRDNRESGSSDTISSRRDKIGTQHLQELAQLAVSTRTYPWRRPVGIAVSAYTAAQIDHFWSTSRLLRAIPGFEGNSAGSVRQHEMQFTTGGSLALGYGKVRDATAVYRTQILEQRLIETHALVRPLARGTREKIAALFFASPDLYYAHERPEKYFWREVERLLREDGALSSGSFDGYSLFRVIEPTLARGGPTRQSGYFVGPAVFLTASRGHAHTRQTATSTVSQADTLVSLSSFDYSQNAHFRSDEATVGGRAEWHRPLGMRWQTDAGTSLQYLDRTHSLTASSSVSASWLVADRWAVSGVVSHAGAWTGIGAAPSHPLWSVFVFGDLTYFLEDAWGVRLSWATQQERQSDAFRRNSRFSVGVTYLISGLFDLPGVMAPQRLTRVVP